MYITTRQRLLVSLIIFAVACLLPTSAQVVSSGMTGTVLEEGGAPVPGAAITAVHTPTNTIFRAVTGANGRFSFRGLPVGGPYTISANAAGFEIDNLTGIETALGEDQDVVLVAKSDIVKLERLVTTASTSDLDANATGAGSVLSSRRLASLPTGRSFSDLMRTNPFVSLRAGEQATALGTNSRFNSIMLDGAKINDSFGLASSGLFSLRNPFSLDAIEQVSISLTPYDIRQSGFAGLAMNVVSKSGTNEFHGTVYDVFTDQNWQGRDITGTTKDTRPTLKERTYGFTLGGPILKDRLFFFLNFEKFIQDRAPITPNFVPDAAFLSAIDARADQLPGSPDFGSFGGVTSTRLFDTKRLAKLDWNITQDHRLSVRYSETIGAQPNTGSLNAASFSQPATITGQPSSFPNTITGLSSNFYILPSKEKVWAGQLFSNWTSNLKSQLSYSHTNQNSLRETPITFPEIRIFNVPYAGGTGGNAIRFGTEISSMGNGVIVTTETFAGSVDYLWKDFTFTVGGDHETSDYTNYFRQGSYGVFDYKNLADFQADRPFGFLRAVVKNGLELADISRYEQTGVFAQAKWDPTARFNVTAGIRVDYLGSPVPVPYNAGFQSAFGVTNAGTIDGTSTPAPRLSFNYSVDRQRNTQIRGGVGVFLGRNPWVWISNSYGNFGVGRFTVSNVVPNATPPPPDFPNPANYTGPTLTQYLNGTYTNTDSAYKFDPANPIGSTNITPSASTTQVINLIKPGLRLPTIRRGNIAIDQKLPKLNAVASIEFIDTQQLSGLFVDNMNLKPTTVGVDGRQRFAGSASSAPIVAGFGNVIRTRNVHAGASQAVAISLDRPMRNGWSYSAAYIHTHATEAQTLGSSTANSQWQFNPVFNQNQVEVGRSDYEVRDRVQITVAKEFRWRKNYSTTVSLYYEGRTGMPYSYVYTNDLNSDGFNGNDVVAVPSGKDDARFDFSALTQAQLDAYLAFIKSSGLDRYAGGHAPRNAFLTPWQNRLDLRFVQELPVVNLPVVHQVKLEIFADFLNFGSWLNKDLFNYVELLNASATNGGQVRGLGAATYNAAAGGKIRPTFVDGTTTVLSLNSANNLVFGTDVPLADSSSASVIRANNGESRWKIQAGVRLRF